MTENKNGVLQVIIKNFICTAQFNPPYPEYLLFIGNLKYLGGKFISLN